MTEIKTTEEKIDYIYNSIKKSEKRALWGAITKWAFRIFIILYFVYFIKVGLPLLIDGFMPSMSGADSSMLEGFDSEQIESIIGNYFTK